MKERKPTSWKPVALDGGYGWVVVFGSFMIHVFADGFVYSFGVMAETFVSEFESTNAEVSVILSLLTGLMLATGPVAGAITNRYGCRFTTILGSVIAAFGCAISYFAYSLSFLIFSIGIVTGVGFGLMYCPALVIVTMYFEKYRSLATGVTVCGAGVGTFVFSKVIAFLVARFDWRLVILIYSCIVLLGVPCGLLYRPVAFEPIYDDEEETEEEKETEKKEENRNIELLAVDNGPLRSAVSHTDVNTGSEVSKLQRVHSLGEHLHKRSRHPSNQSISSVGYLNVKDVFFRRSISELKDFDEKMRSVPSLPSVPRESFRGRKDTHTSTVKEVLTELPEEEDENEDSAATSASRAIEIWRTIKKMVDLSPFTSSVYVIFAISNFLTSIGFNAPPMFMPMNMEVVLGYSKEDAAWTVAVYGIGNICGRIFFGFVCDRTLPFSWAKDTSRNKLWVYNVMLIVCGIATTFVFNLTGFYTFLGYCFVFGFTISSYVCLTTVVLVDLVGVDQLTNAFGLLLLVQGIATFVGPPIAGQLYDLTKLYDWAFAFCGICLFISGAMMFAVPFLRRRSGDRKMSDIRLESSYDQETPIVPKTNGVPA